MFGQRVAFVEVFFGAMEMILGVRALGLCAPDGIDKLNPVGGRPWDLRSPADQERAQELLDDLNPRATHLAPPCTTLCIIGSKPEEGTKAADEGLSMMRFSVDQVRRRDLRSSCFSGEP